MIVLLLLPVLLEFILVSFVLGTFSRFNFIDLRLRVIGVGLFSLVASLALISIMLGGSLAVAMIVKVFFFALAITYAIRKPRAARWWLTASIVISLLAQAAAGNVLNKLSTIPFLLVACLWAAGRARLGRFELVFLVLALGAECIQALVLEGRGLLIAVALACGLLLSPLNLARRTVVASAVLLPIFYPLALTFVFNLLLSGSDILSATSSNLERSAMAAWCIDNLSSFPLVGPGSSLFTEEINAIKVAEQQAVADDYDPHQFLLSAWIWLGSSTVGALYFLWCSIWIPKKSDFFAATDQRIKLFSILAIIAILTFVLSPPDTTARLQVAMLAGIAIAGLRNPSILSRKGRTIAPVKNADA